LVITKSDYFIKPEKSIQPKLKHPLMAGKKSGAFLPVNKEW
jgi:hypothetical protein